MNPVSLARGFPQIEPLIKSLCEEGKVNIDASQNK